MADVCVWRNDDRDRVGCGQPATDAIVFAPDSATMFPDPRVPVCSAHYAVTRAWIAANLGPVIGAADPC